MSRLKNVPLVVGCAVWFGSAWTATAEEQTAEQLVKLVTVIRSNDGDYRSIRINGSARDGAGLHIKFFGLYYARGQ